MIYERGRGSIYDLDANKDTTEDTSVPDVMSSYFTRDPDPEPVRGGRGNIVERPNERNDYLASIIANQMAETQRNDSNQFSHGLDPIPYNLGVPVPPQQTVVNPQTVDARNINPFVTSPYDTGQGAVTDDPYILGDGEDYMPSYARYQKPMGKGYTQIISEGIGDFGQAVYEDPLGVGKAIASGLYEGGKDLLTDPVGTVYGYGKNVVQSGINLGSSGEGGGLSYGLAGYLPEGVTEENATPEQLTAARQAKLGDIFQVGSVVPVAQGVRLAANVAKPALSYGLGQVKSPFIRNAERLNKIVIEAQDQLEASGFRNVGTKENPQFTGAEAPSFIPDAKTNSAETIAEYRARQKIAKDMYAKGATDAEVREFAGIQRVTYKTIDDRTITRDFMLLQSPQFDVDKTIRLMIEGADDIFEEVVSTGDNIKTRYSMSETGKGDSTLGEIIKNIDDYKLLDDGETSFSSTGFKTMTPDLEGDFTPNIGEARARGKGYPLEMRYNPLYARDGSSGLKGSYAGIPYLIDSNVFHEFDHIVKGAGDKEIFNESTGGGLDFLAKYRGKRIEEINKTLEKIETLKKNNLINDNLYKDADGNLSKETLAEKMVRDLEKEREILTSPLVLPEGSYPQFDYDLYQQTPIEVFARGAVPGDPLTTTRTDLNLFGIMNPLVKGDKKTSIGEGLGRAYNELKTIKGLKSKISNLPYILGTQPLGTRKVPISYEQMVPYKIKPDDDFRKLFKVE